MDGFKDEKERLLFRHFILQNMYNSMSNLIKAIEGKGEIINENYRDLIDKIKNITLENVEIDESLGKRLSELWNSDQFQETYKSNYKFHLYDSDSYFLNNLETISKKDYIPSIEDILKVRVKSSGIKEFEFSHKGFNFRIVDVGGQRSERKKWVHCFQDVTAIIFVVALNDFDRILEEDMKTNR